LAKVIADVGYKVLATDVVAYDGCIYPVASGVDALQAPLPAGVRTIASNPPYSHSLLPPLVEHWLALLESVGQLCLCCGSLWGESQRGQALTTRHPA
jgi:hypothetical protein